MKLATGLALFDLDEGPQMRELLPGNFPLDSQLEFEIVSYALLSDGLFSMEREDLFVVGRTFEIPVEHRRARKTKAALIILAKGLKSKQRKLLSDIAEQIINEFIGKFQEGGKKTHELLRGFRTKLIELISKDEAQEKIAEKLVKKTEYSMGKAQRIALIVDSVMKQLILVNCNELTDCLTSAETYTFTRGLRFLIMVSGGALNSLKEYLESIERAQKMPKGEEIIRCLLS